jgi:hypothetical protein
MDSRWRRLRPRTWKGWVLYGFLALLLLGTLLGDSEESKQPVQAKQSAQGAPAARDSAAAEGEEVAAERELAKLRRERARVRRERARVRRERAAIRREHIRARKARAAARRERERQAQIAAEEAATPEPEPAASCHPSYNPCLDPDASDYDCEGGSGDGPEYTGFVTVNGPDPYDLDSDGDGTGCE